ncbi:hypothetical protein J7481_10755 [Labrenzia sp. R4_2]|uniref:hypothetical protein n=1 Tax=Labrenzia sp. R4_2 TaxID=2821107 RepID=UPI001ADCA06E|nr:hypothetical protein [Labrenzia sp. R4_2]MBO9419976.1 hypothetical protein [Labrenzia sp. R4_2]
MRYPNSVKVMVLAAAVLGAGPAFGSSMTKACYEKIHQPAVYKNIKRTIMTHRAHTRWEYQTINGRQVLCKVHRPAVYQTVVQNTLIQPARTVLKRVSARDCTRNARIYSNF